MPDLNPENPEDKKYFDMLEQLIVRDKFEMGKKFRFDGTISQMALEELMKRIKSEKNYLIAMRENKPIGYIKFTTELSPTHATIHTQRNYIIPECRGEGRNLEFKKAGVARKMRLRLLAEAKRHGFEKVSPYEIVEPPIDRVIQKIRKNPRPVYQGIKTKSGIELRKTGLHEDKGANPFLPELQEFDAIRITSKGKEMTRKTSGIHRR